MTTKEATARPTTLTLGSVTDGKGNASADHAYVEYVTGEGLGEIEIYGDDAPRIAQLIVTAVNEYDTLTEENARLSIRVKEMEERETPGASEAFTALDLADNLIERSYGTDVPVEWKRAIKKVVRARAALEQSK